MTTRTASTLAAVLSVCLFAIGVFCGVAADRLWLQPVTSNAKPDDNMPAVIPRLSELFDQLREKLELTSLQAEQIKTLLIEGRRAFLRQLLVIEPEASQIRHRYRTRIRALLTPKQQAAYDVMVRRVDNRQRILRQLIERDFQPPRAGGALRGTP